MFRRVIGELCRVTRDEIVLMEDIGRSREAGGPKSWIGRRVDVHESTLAQHGFELSSVRFLGTAVSRGWYYPLFILVRRLGYRVTDVATALGRDAATISAIVSRLARRLESSDRAAADVACLSRTG